MNAVYEQLLQEIGGYRIPADMARVLEALAGLDDEEGALVNRRARRTRNTARTVWLLQDSLRRLRRRNDA